MNDDKIMDYDKVAWAEFVLAFPENQPAYILDEARRVMRVVEAISPPMNSSRGEAK